MADELLDDYREMAKFASTRSNGKLESALTRWHLFQLAVPGRIPFLPLTGGAGDVQAKRYNAETLGMFSAYNRRVPNLQRGGSGKPIAAGTIEDYAAAIRIHRSLECGYDVLGEHAFDGMVRSRAAKTMRLISTVSVDRELSLGVRAMDIRAAFPNLDTKSEQGVVELAAALFVHNTVSRGADVGIVRERDTPDPERDLMWAHLDWETGAQASPPYLSAQVLPSKDAQVRQRRRPILISRRSVAAPFLSDPLDTYDWIRLAWLIRRGRVTDLARTLFFTHASGRPMCSEDVADIGRRIARAAGWPADRVSKVGAKWGRIGGATDFRAMFGPGSRELLRARGRWGSDIDQIYSRATADEITATSARVGDTTAPDLERLFPGWVQPR